MKNEPFTVFKTLRYARTKRGVFSADAFTHGFIFTHNHKTVYKGTKHECDALFDMHVPKELRQ
jgi:hypothetical protein